VKKKINQKNGAWEKTRKTITMLTTYGQEKEIVKDSDSTIQTMDILAVEPLPLIVTFDPSVATAAGFVPPVEMLLVVVVSFGVPLTEVTVTGK
jgi:hypothetical protein